MLRLAFVLCIAIAACRAPVASTPTLIVASDLDNLPFAGLDEAGRAIGRDVEMMEALAARLGAKLEWRRMPFDRLLPSVESGAVDAACATLGITPERAERVAFTHAYYRTAIAVVVRAGEGEPASLAELDGRRVSGASGTTSERAIRARLRRSLVAFADDKSGPTAERLAAREIDAAVMDGPAADALVAAGAGSLRRLDEALATEDYAIALPLSSPNRAPLDAGLEQLEASGWLDALNARHGLPASATSDRARSATPTEAARP